MLLKKKEKAMEKVIADATFQGLSYDHYTAAEEGKTVYFRAYDWSNGNPIWMQLCHKNHFPETTNPVYGFTEDGFFVKPVPAMLYPNFFKDQKTVKSAPGR
jgi:hypothetical protein